MISALERLADCIRNRRKLLGMSQERLAEETGLSLSLVRRIERKAANPTLTNLEKLASVLGEDIAGLFYIDTTQDTNKLKKSLILTELSQLSVSQLALILQLIKSFQKEEDEYLATTFEKIPVKIKLKDRPTISAPQEEEAEHFTTALGKTPLEWKLKDNPQLSIEKEGEEEYLITTFGKIPVIRRPKDDPPISAQKG